MTTRQNEQLNWDRLVKSQVAIWEIKQQIKKHQIHHPQDSLFQKSVITISRTHGAGGDAVAHEISKILNWPVYDKELVEYIAQTGQVRNRVIEDLDERRQSETQNFVQTMLSKQSIGMDKYFKLLHDVIAVIAQEGQAIIIGRGSHLIVDPKRAMRVMITAPMEWRIERVAREKGLSIKEARKTVSLVDSNRFAFIQRYFHRSANDHASYDLVLNAENLPPQTSARIIINALSTKLGMQKTQEIMQNEAVY